MDDGSRMSQMDKPLNHSLNRDQDRIDISDLFTFPLGRLYPISLRPLEIAAKFRASGTERNRDFEHAGNDNIFLRSNLLGVTGFYGLLFAHFTSFLQMRPNFDRHASSSLSFSSLSSSTRRVQCFSSSIGEKVRNRRREKFSYSIPSCPTFSNPFNR